VGGNLPDEAFDFGSVDDLPALYIGSHDDMPELEPDVPELAAPVPWRASSVPWRALLEELSFELNDDPSPMSIAPAVLSRCVFWSIDTLLPPNEG
jgi:hypothetical protein